MQYLIKYGITKYFESVSYTWRGTEIVYIKFVLKCLKIYACLYFFHICTLAFFNKSNFSQKKKCCPHDSFILLFFFSNQECFVWFVFFSLDMSPSLQTVMEMTVFFILIYLDELVWGRIQSKHTDVHLKVKDFAQRSTVCLCLSWILSVQPPGQNISHCSDLLVWGSHLQDSFLWCPTFFILCFSNMRVINSPFKAWTIDFFIYY